MLEILLFDEVKNSSSLIDIYLEVRMHDLLLPGFVLPCRRISTTSKLFCIFIETV